MNAFQYLCVEKPNWLTEEFCRSISERTNKIMDQMQLDNWFESSMHSDEILKEFETRIQDYIDKSNKYILGRYFIWLDDVKIINANDCTDKELEIYGLSDHIDNIRGYYGEGELYILISYFDIIARNKPISYIIG